MSAKRGLCRSRTSARQPAGQRLGSLLRRHDASGYALTAAHDRDAGVKPGDRAAQRRSGSRCDHPRLVADLDRIVGEAARWLSSSIGQDGHGRAGWGWVPDVPPNPQNTAEVVCRSRASATKRRVSMRPSRWCEAKSSPISRAEIGRSRRSSTWPGGCVRCAASYPTSLAIRTSSLALRRSSIHRILRLAAGAWPDAPARCRSRRQAQQCSLCWDFRPRSTSCPSSVEA
jgi:hypothetical protein